MTEDEVVAIVEGIAPVTWDVVTKANAALVQRQAALEAQLTQLIEVAKEIGPMRERLAVLETRAPVPGPPGPAGRDGVDGLGFDDLDFVVDDARKGCFLRFTCGDQVKEFRLPIPFDVGTFHDGEHYEKANVVTWASSWWIAKAPTTDKPGDGATAWRLTVKGRR